MRPKNAVLCVSIAQPHTPNTPRAFMSSPYALPNSYARLGFHVAAMTTIVGKLKTARRIVEALYLRRSVVVCKVGLTHRIYSIAAIIVVYDIGGLGYRYLIEQLLPFGRVIVGAQLFAEVGYNAVFGNFKVARSAPRYGGGVYGVAERVRRGVVPLCQPSAEARSSTLAEGVAARGL